MCHQCLACCLACRRRDRRGRMRRDKAQSNAILIAIYRDRLSWLAQQLRMGQKLGRNADVLDASKSETQTPAGNGLLWS